ncbi:MAG: flagellar biosynthesis anti-sigma factor FlgM [Clostridiales bacterium]|nr:flagellar biosynthesis anti-sigma factor FlgM [Clostridiales bacterium]
MKINSISGNQYINKYHANKVSIPEKEKPSGRSDQVTFSDEALNYTRSLGGIKDKITLHSAEEKEKIADLKSRINKGQYKVDSEQVAAKIIDRFFK